MSNDPVESGEGADDLLGRWLAHHDQAADDEDVPPPRRIGTAAGPSEAAASRTTRPSASAVLADLRDANAVAPPSAFGVRRGLPGSAHSGPSGGAANRGADDEIAELDRPSPVGFEPVLLRSVRNKSVPKDEQEKDRHGPLSRLRSRATGPVEQPESSPADQPVSLYDEPVALISPPVFRTARLAPVAPESQTETPRPIVSYQDVIALATAASLPVAEPEVEPSLRSEETAVPGAVDTGAPAKRRLVARTRRPETDEAEERKRRPLVPRSGSAPNTGTGTGNAARGLLAAARAALPAPQAPPARPVPVVEPVPTLPVDTVVETPVPASTPMEMPAVYEFTPLRSARRFLSLMLIAGLILSGYLGYTAYQSRDTVEIGIAAIVTLAALVIWAIRAGATVTRFTVRRGQLEISRQGGRMVFDLASTYTPIEVVGRPGTKKWKVLFLRRGLSPVVVDSTMVDAQDFMRVLRFFRPDVI